MQPQGCFPHVSSPAHLKFASLTIMVFVVIGFSSDPVTAQIKEESQGTLVRDSVIVRRVLKTVRSHVLSITKDRRKPLVIKQNKKSRRFIVVEFPREVSKSKSGYTAQIDVDEYDHKIPRILYVDVKVSKGKYKVTRIRIGPNHFRDSVQK
jgi:hypothetical protein